MGQSYFIYTFERDCRVYKKEVSSVYYYPISKKVIIEELEKLGYGDFKVRPHLYFSNDDIYNVDWYGIFCRKRRKNNVINWKRSYGF